MFQWILTLLGREKQALRTVLGFTDQHIASKLLSIGVLPGSQLQIIRKAPGGFVYFIKVDGVSIALRKNELQAIILKQLNE